MTTLKQRLGGYYPFGKKRGRVQLTPTTKTESWRQKQASAVGGPMPLGREHPTLHLLGQAMSAIVHEAKKTAKIMHFLNEGCINSGVPNG